MRKTICLNNSVLKVGGMLITCLLFLTLASCSIKEGKEQEKTIQLIWWGDRYNRDFAIKLVEIYNRREPETKVVLLTEHEYWTKLQTMIAGGTAPDIFLLYEEQAYELARRGQLLQLDIYSKSPDFVNFKNDIWKELRGELSYNGNLFAIPIWTSTMGIFYNKDIFDRAGVEYPSHDWDIEDLLEKAKRLTLDNDGDGRIDQFGFQGFPFTISDWDIYLLIKMFGGELYSNDLKSCLITEPEAVAAVRWATELITKHHVCPTFSEAHSMIGQKSGIELFLMGKMAMGLSGRWLLDDLLKGTKFEWGVVPLPRGKGKVMFQVPICLGISANTKDPQGAWEFVKFVMGKEGQRLLAMDRTDIPVMVSIANSPEFLNYGEQKDANRVFLEMLEYAKLRIYVPGTDKWKASANDKLTLVILGKLTVEEACKQIASEFQEMVR